MIELRLYAARGRIRTTGRAAAPKFTQTKRGTGLREGMEEEMHRPSACLQKDCSKLAAYEASPWIPAVHAADRG